MDASYDRPVKGTLIVRLDNGEEWEATPEDLAKFRVVPRLEAYMTFNRALTRILTDHGLLGDDNADGYTELTNAELNPLRYLVETALSYPDLLDHPEHEEWQSVADLERRLRATRATPTPAALSAYSPE